MINKKRLIFFLIFVFLYNCSFDKKTGIWDGDKKEKRRISELEQKQKNIIDVYKIYTSENIYSKNIVLKESIALSKPINATSWKMNNLNHQNFLGNIYLSAANNFFLKKKIGKNKFSLYKMKSSLLASKNYIIFSDDTGTIFNINDIGKINWKKNIYKKVYKKIYKNLTLSIHDNNIYVADNIGFIYAINLNSGKTIWIKNHGKPLKSNIKIFNDKIFLIDQDNQIICLDANDGSRIWNVVSISSFIKSQNLMSLALTEKGNLIALNSSADLFNINSNNGSVYWATNTLGSLYTDAADFFKSSDIVISDEEIIFSTSSSIFSYNLKNGFVNWNAKAQSASTPIVDGKNVFFVTDNGYFVIINKNTGKIISSSNILKILKKRHQETKITGFIMGSGKIYAVTLNGNLIVSSAITGRVEYFKKIGDPITTPPIIKDGKLYILTENSRIIGLN